MQVRLLPRAPVNFQLAISSFQIFLGSVFKKLLKIEHGPLAHLVERIHGMDEATGSIPVGSTINVYAKQKKHLDGEN